MGKQTRVCKRCKDKIYILKDDYLKVKTGYIHTDCYIESQLNKNLSMDIIKEGINVIKEMMKMDNDEKIKKEREAQQLRLKAKKEQINRRRELDEFDRYVKEKYDITKKLPNYFYSKLADINSGVHPSVNKPIPYSDLLIMFKKQEAYLNKINEKRKSIGKELKREARLNYDLAIIVSMYDSYLDWKRRQEILESDARRMEKLKKESKLNINKIAKQSKQNDDDLSDILDDIY